MDPFTAVRLGLMVLETAERIHGARIEAAQKEEADAIADHLARTAAAHAVIKGVDLAGPTPSRATPRRRSLSPSRPAG